MCYWNTKEHILSPNRHENRKQKVVWPTKNSHTKLKTSFYSTILHPADYGALYMHNLHKKTHDKIICLGFSFLVTQLYIIVRVYVHAPVYLRFIPNIPSKRSLRSLPDSGESSTWDRTMTTVQGVTWLCCESAILNYDCTSCEEIIENKVKIWVN